MGEPYSRVLAVQLPAHGLDELEAAARGRLPAHAATKVARLLRVGDRVRSLLGLLLLQRALRERGIADAELHLVSSDEGKPRLRDHPQLHFNISHAGAWVVCAVSPFAVGIDVEQCREIDGAIAQRFFQPGEHAALLATPEPERPKFFFRQWTAKEAYLKALGTGLQKDLRSFGVDILDDVRVALHDQDRAVHDWRIAQWQLDETHVVALCESARCASHRLSLIPWQALIDGLP